MKVTKPQIKLFANGVKAVLTSKGKNRQLLQLFDKENCMIAQREIQQTVKSDLYGKSRTLEKITIRKNKDQEGMLEYLSMQTSASGRNSYRIVEPEYANCHYINTYMSLSGKTEYLKKLNYLGLNSDQFTYRNFPLLKSSNQPKTKREEIAETFDNMWKQWYNPKAKEDDFVRVNPKPMMSQHIKNVIANA